jgi:hypothetical protein
MDVALRGVVCSLTILVTGATAFAAGDAPAKAPVAKKVAEYADPKSTFRTYIDAVRKNNAPAAKECWVLDDDDKSGVLDVLVGKHIALRRLNQAAVKKFGKEWRRAISKDLRLDEVTDQVTDQALDLTKKRLGKATVRIKGNKAELRIKREKDDGNSEPAFEDSGGEPIPFRKVGKNWKIDANKLMGIKRGSEFFKEGSMPPVGVVFSGWFVIANEAVNGMQKGKLKTAKEVNQFMKRRWKAWFEEYAGWLKKHIAERKKADSRRK